MSQPLDDELFDDLAEPEGPASSRHPFDEPHSLDDFADPLDADPLDDPVDGVEFDAGELMDELEDAVTEALDADDADEFFGKLFQGIRNVAKKVAPIVSQVAPLLPIPGAGLIGKAADIVGQVAADEADELDAFDGMIDIADEADSFDAAAPVAAALAVRKAVPNAARLPHQQRKQLVKAAGAATRHIAQRHGPAAAAAVPAIVRHARRTAVQQGASPRQLPQLVRRTAARVARSPQLIRRFARASAAMRTAPGMGGGGWEGPGSWTAPTMGMGSDVPGMGTAYGVGGRRRGTRRRRRGYGAGGYGWEGGIDDGWGQRAMMFRRRRRGYGPGGYGPGGYGYSPRMGGGAWGDRRITLSPGSQITIEAI
jgi:hypothetical protein